jgi:hypothetical protein
VAEPLGDRLTKETRMSDSYPYLEVGDEVTLDLVTGLQGLHGTVEALDLADDGGIRCLSIREIAAPEREPLRVRGDLIALWRKGTPVRQIQRQQMSPGELALNLGRLPGNSHR